MRLATASATAGFSSPASVPSRQAGATGVTALLRVHKRVGPATGFRDPCRTCARMGIMKGQHSERALALPGNANVAFAPDGRSRYVSGFGADKVMRGTPSGAPARATADIGCLRLAPDGE